MADVTTGIRLEATGAEEYKQALKEAANAGDDLETSLSKLESAEGDSADKSKALNAAVKGLAQESKTLAAKMKALESGFDESTSAEERASQKKQLLNEQIETQRGYILGLNEQLAQMAQNSDVSSAAMDRQREKIYRAQTALNGMESSLRQLDGGLDEATDATEELGEATEEATESTSNFRSVLSANLVSEAAIKGLEAVVGLAKNIATEMFNAARDSAAFADDIQTLAVQTGLSTEALQEFQYMAEFIDVPLDTITGSLAKLIPKMSEAAEGIPDFSKYTASSFKIGESTKKSAESLDETQKKGNEALEMFQKLGVDVKDSSGQLRDNVAVFYDVIEALGKIENPTERDAIAMELFGKKAQELNPLIAAGSDTLQAFADEAHRNGYVLNDSQLETLAQLDDSYNQLNNTLDSIKRKFAVGLAPALALANKKLAELAGSADWEGLGQSIGSVISALVENGIEIIDSVDLAKVGQDIEDTFTWIQENSDAIATAIEAIGAAFGTWAAVSVVSNLVTQAQKLYSTLTAVGGLLGVSSGIGAAAMGGGLLLTGGAAVASAVYSINDLKHGGEIGLDKTEEEYLANIKALKDAAIDAQRFADENEYAEGQAGADYDAIHAWQRLQNAEEEYQAWRASRPETPAETPVETGLAEEAAAAEEAVSNVESAGAEMLERFDESAGEINSSYMAGVDEASEAAAKACENTHDVMAENMAILDANAYIWGVDMMREFANGIVDGSNTFVLARIEELAEQIKKRIGYSEPDIGPLSHTHEWGPDMMRLFAEGIRSGKPLLEAAIGDSFDLGAMIAAANAGTQTLNYGGVSVVINAAPGQSAEDLYDVFSYRLARDISNRREVYST